MPRTITRFILAGVLLGSTALAACGGGSGSESLPAASAPAAATVTPSAGAVKASISGFAFAPKQLKVRVGQQITWTNQDSAAHTVTATSGAKFDSGTVAQGASFTWKATKPGTVEYFCAIHPSMTGTIVVR